MSSARTRRARRLRALALGAALALAALGLAWCCAPSGADVLAPALPESEERAPAAALPDEAANAPGAAVLASPSGAPEWPELLPLDERLAGLVRELVNPRFQPRVYDERLRAALDLWPRGQDPVLRERLAQAPPGEAELAALASLALERGLALEGDVRARLAALAFREDGPPGLALVPARTLLAQGGAADVARWCELFERGSERQRLVASFALGCVRDPAALGALALRAGELADAPGGSRLLDVLGRALEGAPSALDETQRGALAASLAQLADDSRCAAGTRTRALGVLARLDGARAARLACAWMLDPTSDAARVERAGAVLRRTGAALDGVLLDQAPDAERRVRLAECLLALDPRSGAALAALRSALEDASPAPARRRALHALVRYGSDADRERVTALGAGDPDAAARAAAGNALARAVSAWP